MRNYYVAVSKIEGGLGKVAVLAKIHKENVKRNLRGETKDPSKVLKACEEMLRNEVKEIQELLPDVNLFK